jgi:DNA-binding NtrC family response regulator
VDALTPRAQVVLLRLLQDRAFRSLGSAREQQADIRFVAATNASLPALVQSRGFRADLYYRLCVFTFSLPPLRERRDDILELAAHFMALHAVVGRQSLSLSSRAAGALLAHDWPGNVRELENSMIRAVGVAAGPSIELEDLGLPVGPDADASGEAPAHGTLTALKRHVVETFERQYLARLLIEHRGNVSNAARAAGRERRDFGRLLRKYQLDRSLFGTPRRAGGS